MDQPTSNMKAESKEPENETDDYEGIEHTSKMVRKQFVAAARNACNTMPQRMELPSPAPRNQGFA